VLNRLGMNDACATHRLTIQSRHGRDVGRNSGRPRRLWLDLSAGAIFPIKSNLMRSVIQTILLEIATGKRESNPPSSILVVRG